MNLFLFNFSEDSLSAKQYNHLEAKRKTIFRVKAWFSAYSPFYDS
jgi:hypothetical protein